MGMPLATPKKNLPRMRGDHPMQILGDGFVLKFTPQARGSTQFDMPPARRASIYPACAGINHDALTAETAGMSKVAQKFHW